MRRGPGRVRLGDPAGGPAPHRRVGLVGLYLASWLAAVLLVEPVEAASDALLTRLAPCLWSAVYQDPATVLVYAPQHAVAFAAALLAIAVLLRRDASQRRPTDTAAT